MGDPNSNYHYIIGLVVMACLILQPAFGLLHHERFKLVKRRQFWSYVHLLNGRVVITLGIVNGALGLWIAEASDNLKIAYLAAAASMWGLWMAVAAWREYQIWRDNGPNRPKKPRRRYPENHRLTASDEPVGWFLNITA
ncbi:hypothetical protein B0I37DRAFT_382552, partial [Chaetomium sp. MPI-CAGE-AT-0009]